MRRMLWAPSLAPVPSTAASDPAGGEAAMRLLKQRPGGSARKVTLFCTGHSHAWSTVRASRASSDQRIATTSGQWRWRRRLSKRLFISELGGNLWQGPQIANSVTIHVIRFGHEENLDFQKRTR